MHQARNWVITTALLAVLLVLLLRLNSQRSPSAVAHQPLVVFCAAGLKAPVEAVAREYERVYGVPVQLQFGGSGTLLSNLRVAGKGDLFVAADESYLRMARTNELLDEVIPLARMVPVIAVPKGNPKNVQSIRDLQRVSVALANPDAAAIGQVTREILQRTGDWAALEAHVRVFKPTVNDVANDLKLGTVDAGILWDATVRQYPELEMVRVPALVSGEQRVALGVLRSSTQPAAALHFARYLAARDRGLKEFARFAFEPVAGDVWAESPQVTLYSGGVNRLAIEETVAQFEKREGVRVTRVYNGCGILVAQMKAGQRPDAYFACDVSFLHEVSPFFSAPQNISRSDVVLLVPRGNPKSIQGLRDLAASGLRVGMAHEQQSALGALTVRLLKARNLYESVLGNVKVQTPTADLLVNQMRAGALDVAVVYEANTSQVRDLFTVVPLSEPGAEAMQPFAVGLNSDHRWLMDRLRSCLRSRASRDRFESAGFHWCPDEK